MMELLDHIAFVCLSGAAIGFAFLIIAGIFKLINYLSKGKFEDVLINFYEEESDE